LNNLAEIQSYVRMIVSRKIWNHLDQEDVASEVYLALCKGDFKGDSKFRTYVYGIAKRRINDYFREKYRALAYEASMIAAENIDFQNDAAIWDLNLCIRRLPDMERFIIVLHDLAEMDFKDVHRILRRSTHRIIEVRKRGLKMLRIMLERRGY
jgi:RNA polymerase sigma factor (sigma-70 family)